jgi:hypothetical protein
MDQPDKASSPHILLLISRINPIQDCMDSYLNERGKEEQAECQKLLEQHEGKYGRSKATSYSPWPFYLIGSTHLGPHYHRCGSLSHERHKCPQPIKWLDSITARLEEMQGDSEGPNQSNGPMLDRDLSDNEQGSLFADSGTDDENESISVSNSNNGFDNHSGTFSQGMESISMCPMQEGVHTIESKKK